MKQIIHFTARFALEDCDDDWFYTLHSASREYNSILDCLGLETRFPVMMQKRADEADKICNATGR